MKEELIKGSGHNIDIETLKVEFMKTYAIKMGWNASALTEEQMNEIKGQKEYKSPVLKS